MKKLLLGLVCVLVSGCGGKLEPSNLATSSPYRGYWLQQSEAEELRKTGRVDSLCPELQRDPAVIINTRLIDAGGTVYAYNPQFGRAAEMQMGNVADDGAFTPSPAKSQSLGIVKGRASITGEVLTFVYETNDRTFPKVSMSYLRSSEEEIGRYFRAQDACRGQ